MNLFPERYYNPRGGDAVAKARTFVEVASPDTETLVAAPSGTVRIAVFSVEIRSDVDATVVFKSGTTAISATEYVAASGGSNMGSPDNQMALFKATAGEALNVTTTGTGNVSVSITYAIIPG
jgi:hypothetical protein